MQDEQTEPDDDRKVVCPLCAGMRRIQVLHFDAKIITTRECDACESRGWVERPRG